MNAMMPMRLLDKVRVDEDGCWRWTASHTWNGYGQGSFAGQTYMAHRIFYFVYVGQIPKDHDLDHLCRVRDCVNPGHLEAVTRQENALRRTRLITHCPQGHEFTPENTSHSRGWRGCKTCHSNRQRARRERQRKEASLAS